MIQSLYRDYFQKSRVFLYPVLETKRGGSVTPIDTYVSWEGKYSPADRKLICTFYLRNDVDYKRFEKNSLIGNEMFWDFHEGETGLGIYVFDFEKLAINWDLFLKGQYSRMEQVVKERITRHYASNSANAVYVDSFLYPAKYYHIYADLLNVPVSTLKGGELCDKPDLMKEHLKMLIKGEVVSGKSLDLPQT